MNTEEAIKKLINGDIVIIKEDSQAKEIQAELRKIKKNCSIVLSQLKERLS